MTEVKPPARVDFVGMFFLTYVKNTETKKRELGYQGRIVQHLFNDFYLVQYNEWFMGTPSTYDVVSLSQISHQDWSLFTDIDDWREAGSRR